MSIPGYNGRLSGRTESPTSPIGRFWQVADLTRCQRHGWCHSEWRHRRLLVMKLSSRFAVDVALVTGSAFLVAAALSFSPPVAGWLSFSVSAALAVLAVAGLALAPDTGNRIGHGLAWLVAVWSVAASLIFSGTALTWLVFADAVALGLIALADLTAHEVTTENVVHRLEVAGDQAADSPAGRIAA
jgi:hypothetical protein